MRDFYRRLKLPEDATRKEIRLALSGVADVELQKDGATVLLDERRKSVYDRNRNLLVTIGNLRSHLGLYLAPFWARGDHSDFTYGAPPPTTAQRINSLIVTQAFAPTKRKRRYRRGGHREVIAAVIGGVIALGFIIGTIYFVTHQVGVGAVVPP